MVDQHDINAIHSRITKEAAESVQRDHAIEKHQERTTSHLEQLAAAQKETNRKVDRNGDGIVELKKMHAEFLQENKYTCKAVADAVDIAKAARTIAEDVAIATEPIVQDFNDRSIRKKSWRGVFYKVAGVIIAAGILGFLGWLIPIIIIIIKGGGT